MSDFRCCQACANLKQGLHAMASGKQMKRLTEGLLDIISLVTLCIHQAKPVSSQQSEPITRQGAKHIHTFHILFDPR